MAMKMLTDARSGACFVDARAVVALRADPFNPEMTEVLLADGHELIVRGFPAEVHDWLFSDKPMVERATQEEPCDKRNGG